MPHLPPRVARGPPRAHACTAPHPLYYYCYHYQYYHYHCYHYHCYYHYYYYDYFYY